MITAITFVNIHHLKQYQCDFVVAAVRTTDLLSQQLSDKVELILAISLRRRCWSEDGKEGKVVSLFCLGGSRIK